MLVVLLLVLVLAVVLAMEERRDLKDTVAKQGIERTESVCRDDGVVP